MSLSIEEQMAASLAAEAGETTESVTERVVEAEGDKKSALAQMMENAKAAATEQKVVRKQASAAKGATRTKKATVDKTLRDVIVLKAASVNTAYTLTNGFYTGMDAEKTIAMCRKYIGNRKNIGPLLGAVDLECYRAHALVAKDEAEDLKAWAHDDLVAEGFTVLSTRPKGVDPKPVELDETPTEDVVVEETTDQEVEA